MLNEKFFLALAFLSFVILVFKYGRSSITGLLDNKLKSIAETILSAKETKKNAEKLLIEAEKYYNESRLYADKLISDAQLESQKIIQDSAKLITEEINKRTASALEKIASEEDLAIRQIKLQIISAVSKTISDDLSKSITQQNHDYLTKMAITDFEQILSRPQTS